MHGHDGSIPFSVLSVLSTETFADILWQDGTTSRERTIGLGLHLNVDEYDAWPGDHVLFKGTDGERVAVVQKVHASDRTAEIKLVESKVSLTASRSKLCQWCSLYFVTQLGEPFQLSSESSLVSVLELDPHGQHPETFGVARGDIVLIGRSDNGCEPPRVPRIGEFDEPADDPDQMRATMTRLALSNRLSTAFNAMGSWFTARLGMSSDQVRPPGVSPYDLNKSLDAVDWYGEVLDLRLDGLVEIVLPNGRVVVERMERLSILNEAGDPPFDGEGDEEGDEMLVGEEDGEWTDDGSYVEGEELIQGEVDAWEAMDADDDEGRELDATEDLTMLSASLDTGRNLITPPSVPASCTPFVPTAAAASTPSVQPSANVPSLSDLLSTSASSTPKDDPHWERFAMLEEAPLSHHFYGNVGKPNAAFLSRLQKEFKVPPRVFALPPLCDNR